MLGIPIHAFQQGGTTFVEQPDRIVPNVRLQQDLKNCLSAHGLTRGSGKPLGWQGSEFEGSRADALPKRPRFFS